MSGVNLSEGAINAFETNRSAQFPTPLLQIVSQIKEITNTNTGPQKLTRYRAMVSDGSGTINVFFATQLNPLIESKEVDKFTVIKVNQYQVNPIKDGKLLLIILDMDLVATLNERISSRQGTGQQSFNAPPPATKPDFNNTNQRAGFEDKNQGFQQQKPPSYGSASNNQNKPPARGGFNSIPIAQNNSSVPSNIFPIKSINPYQNRWTICARVLQKSEIRTWSNQRGTGRLFNVTFMDDSGEIRATGFNDQVDQFYGLLEVGKVFYMSSARVNMANPKFNQVKNEYELVLEPHTEISPCNDSQSVPEVKYSFVKLSALGDVEKDKMIDVIAVVTGVSELSEIKSRATNKIIPKRELTISDDSLYSVRLTLWGSHAENYALNDNPIIAFVAVRVGDFGGRSLSMMSASSMIPNPDLPEAYRLRSWYDTEGKSANFNTFNSSGVAGAPNLRNEQLKTVAQVRDEALGMGDGVDYYTLDSTILYIRQENIAYPACPSESCNKKVIQENDQWRCENCQRSYPAPEYRYIISINVSDHTGNLWLQCFNETAIQILGVTANELYPLYETNREEYDSKIAKANFSKFRFRCRAKNEIYNDTARVRHSVTGISRINYAEDSTRLFNLISEYN
ncbi:hypothetical protein BB558_002098 [Smittium angustum]|uniref:Replication protein A subunit n=1 Tax=Smittium angustum TaxID=133377 RepID=A0A2U1J9J0_SMIAN|nr:hypothetical protein BB558_002098 [Smittium angustum]